MNLDAIVAVKNRIEQLNNRLKEVEKYWSQNLNSCHYDSQSNLERATGRQQELEIAIQYFNEVLEILTK
jgi:hypothetical protein